MNNPWKPGPDDDRIPIGPSDCSGRKKRVRRPVEYSIVDGKEVYGRLTVDRLEGRTAYCTCSCGATRILPIRRLKSGQTRGCGCLAQEARSSNGKRNKTHGLGHGKTTPTYKSWLAMRDRCLSPNNKSYPNYGGRGIVICDRWSRFENFRADMGERPSGLTLDRIDVNGNYEPGNCRWATPKQQTRNRRITLKVNIDGEDRTLGQACEEAGISYDLAERRLRTGWTPEDALYAPIVRPGYSRDGNPAAWGHHA